jgi:magnesium chelatase subunit D
VSDHDTDDANWTAPLLALAGPSIGGVVLNEAAEASWLSVYHQLSSPHMQLRTVPSSVSSEQLAGALDLAATLVAGKAVMQDGLLNGDHPKALFIRRATQLQSQSAALLAHALDQQSLVLVASDDSLEDEEGLAPALSDRLTFDVRGPITQVVTIEALKKARKLFARVTISDTWINALVNASLSLGIPSPRVTVQAVTCAKALAALNSRSKVSEDDVTRAARLVLAHRAQRLLQQEEQQEQSPQPPDTEPDQSPATDAGKPADAEVVVSSVKAALPPHVLQALVQGQGQKAGGRSRRDKQKNIKNAPRGRVTGAMRASNLSRQRLNILATLRIAAPWQALRRKVKTDRLVVLRDDLRVSRRKQRTEATAIFAVDASGSTAFQRLAEAKGAVETLLSECYVRRDRVAMIAFRSKTAEVLLPPSRSLERARRALTALAGGGGTPLASALDQIYAIADQVKRSGGKPVVILLTDGRANVTRDGQGDKVKAMAESEEAAKRLSVERMDTMVLDVSPEPQKSARQLANNLAGRYLHLPRAGAADLARPVRAALQSATR